VVGLPLALSLSTIFHFFLLLIFLKKNIKEINFKEIFQSFLKIILGSFLMVLFVYFSLYFLDNFLNTQTFLGLFFQTIGAFLVGFSIYILTNFILKSPELKNIKSSILKQFIKS